VGVELADLVEDPLNDDNNDEDDDNNDDDDFVTFLISAGFG
jgi:hypothetical protein